MRIAKPFDIEECCFLKSPQSFEHSFTDCKASAHLYFSENLPLSEIPLIANDVTDLKSKDLFHCRYF